MSGLVELNLFLQIIDFMLGKQAQFICIAGDFIRSGIPVFYVYVSISARKQSFNSLENENQ